MTTVTAIEDVLKNEKSFGGVFFYDQLSEIPLHKLYKKAVIILYVTVEESASGEVGHFVVLDNRDVVKNDGWHHLYYFDSYGVAPDIGRDILQLPNTKEISNLILRINAPWKYNKVQFQMLRKWDKLCGVYSVSFVLNPNFKTNPMFQPNSNRLLEDERLTRLFHKLRFVN